MRLIFKALLVLACLITTLPAVGADFRNPEFIRIQRNENRDPVALQTAIAKYVPAGGEKGAEIDLVAVVHIGEQAYYERLNKEFEKYDALLYELVAPEGNKPPKGGEMKSDNPLAMLQQGMTFFLGLEHQLEVVDYRKSNFIHADLSPEGMKKAMKERGDDKMTIILGVIADLLRKRNLDADKPEPQAPDISLTDLLNPKKFKRIMAQQFEDAGGDVSLGGTINRLLVEDRNKACIKVLQQQLTAGKKKIAIFYGAAHMPDFDKRLKEDFGMKRTESEWITAWNLADDGGFNHKIGNGSQPI
ncbi:MAG TPA: hypothetical protein VKB87_23610 [Myxococcaceae bacterium]|nr:hypothetical protein [Myxococcaceae bacterium]